MDRNFIKDSLSRGGVYPRIPEFVESALKNDKRIPKEERKGILELGKKATPELVQETLENTLDSFFDYLEGKSKTITFHFPAKQLGLPGNTQETYTFPQGEIPKTNNPAVDYFKMANGGKSALVLATLAFISFTVIVFFGHIRLGGQEKTKGSGTLLLVCGTMVLFISIAGKLFLMQIARNLPQSAEPSQQLITILAPSVVGNILSFWLTIASISVIVGLTLIFAPFKKHSNP